MSKNLMISTKDVRAALRERYSKPEWAYFEEVANGTGITARRYADAVALNLYPSRGLTLCGFEIKISRSDWLNELKKPDKAEESIVRYCDHWFIVTLPGIIHDGELPSNWGLILYQNGKLREAVKAPKLPGSSLDRPFVAALLRRANEADQEAIDAMVNHKVQKIRDELETSYQQREERNNRSLVELRENIASVKALTGIDLGYTLPDDVAQMLKIINNSNIAANYRGLAGLLDTLQNVQEQIHSAIEEFPMVKDFLNSNTTRPYRKQSAALRKVGQL